MKSLHLLFIFIILSLFCFGNAPDLPPYEVLCNNSGSDPMYADQWHLLNRQNSALDVNVQEVWNENIKGQGINIAVVDDGMDIYHEDLKENINLNASYNYLDGSHNTTGSGDCDEQAGASCHGTAVAGVAAAAEKNNKGGRGAAPCATLRAYNLLQYFTDENELDAMIRLKNEVYVSNNSWGPPDYTGQLMSAELPWIEGIEEGIESGRQGKGILYTWAAGNGGTSYEGDEEEVDNSNYDGFANFYGVMAVAAINDQGRRAYYSEKGANIWVSTFSDGGDRGISTTDVSGLDGYGDGDYTADFGGTSSAAPLAAGLAALVFQINPNFTWRDVKLILALSAKHIDAQDDSWAENSAGIMHSYKYGFGSIDALAAVQRARNWTLLSKFVKYESPDKQENKNIPDNNVQGIESSIFIDDSIEDSINKIEYLAINIKVKHPEAGDLEIVLISPGGTESILAESHNCYDYYSYDYDTCSYFTEGESFRFGSARYLNESPQGTWKLLVRDLREVDIGTLQNWSLIFYGRKE